ncbi:holo-ACP synthase [Amycolatopsis tolypomycina]|uniref:Holo-[acyl-carrier-protein] synthase n=1 Tax=Amycolatopsis tolypomycina TaxID=208445 RepID=A0A1H4TPS1_9PSEU|nr:holo-ACP synthase [Amycolatopsis tolypomycina]SEC58483.1 acyl carrier protein [Amycolatopsis tolypomycina]
MRIGVDLMSIPRFAEVAAHHRYRTLVFTPVELEQAARMGAERSLERLAGRFSVKEATCKMLGRGFGQGLRWRDIEVTNDDWGAPLVTLGGGAAEIAEEAGLAEIVVTLSHQADLVVAVAAAGCARPPRPFRRAAEPAVSRVPARFDELAALAADLFSVPPTEVATATSFAGDLGVTSVVVIELLARIEHRYGIRIPEAGIYRMTDLQRTYGVVAEAAGW